MNKIKQLQLRQKDQRNNNDREKENLQVFFCRITYVGAQSYRLLMNSTKNLKRIINKPFILKNIYKTTQISLYCNQRTEFQII